MLILNSSIDRGLLTETLSLMKPHKKFTKSVRSRDLAGEEMSPCREMIRSGKFILNKSLLSLALRHVTPYCQNIFTRSIFFCYHASIAFAIVTNYFTVLVLQHHALTRQRCIDCSSITREFSQFHMRQFYLFTYLLRQK